MPKPMRTLRILAIILVPAALGVLLFREVLLEGRVFFWGDTSWGYMPLLKLAQEAFRAGRLPVWTDALGGGFPLLAEGQVGVFYPLRLLDYLGVPYYQAYSWTVYAQCLLGAVGCGLLGRRLGLGGMAATLAGLAYGFSGYFLVKIQYLAALQSGAWLPLVLLCLVAGVESGRWQWFVGAAGALGLCVYGGHPQYVFYTVLAAGLLLAWLVGKARQVRWPRRLARVVVGGLLAVTLGLALGAAQLLPTATLVRYGERRAEPTPEFLRSIGMRPPALAYYVHPFLMGSPAHSDYRSLGGGADYWETCAFSGGLTLLLGTVALFSRRLPLRYKWFWVLLAAFGVFMALAHANPVFEYLPRVPGFNLFRAAARYQIFTALGLALVAGGAVQALAGERRRLAGRALAGWSLAALVPAGLITDSGLLRGVPAKWASVAPHLSLQDPHWLAFLVGLAVALVVGVLIWRGRLPYGVAAAALLLAVAGQLYLFGREANPTAPATFYTSPPQTALLDLAQPGWGRVLRDENVYYDLAPPGYGGWAGGDLSPYFAWREVLRPNLPLLWGLRTAYANSPLAPHDHELLYADRLPRGLAGKPGGLAAPEQVLRMAGVRTLISVPGLHSPWLRPVLPCQGYTVYQVVAPLPRAWLPERVTACVTLEGALQGLAAADFRPEQRAYVEGLPPRMAARLQGSGGVAGLVADQVTDLSFEVSAPQAAFLVVSMSYYPLWRAEVNGQPATLYRVNAVQCGLPVPPGTSRVRLVYEPSDLWLGAKISAGAAVVAALLLLLTAAAAQRTRRREPSAAETAPPQGEA